MPITKQHGGARLRAGRHTKQVKQIEDEKFLFMARLSSKEPIQPLQASMPCQTPGCPNSTDQGVIQMVNRVWSIRPICAEHAKEQDKKMSNSSEGE